MHTLITLSDGLRMLRELSPRDRAWVVTRAARNAEIGPALAELLRRAEPLIQTGWAPSVFLSHSHKDKAFVRGLAKRLESFGIRVWLDEAELHFGDSLMSKLSQVIKDIDLVVAVISPFSVQSSWVLEELQWAMTHQVEGKVTKVLPVVKAPCVQPPFLAGKLFADFSSPYRRKRNLEPLVSSIFHQSAQAHGRQV